MKKEKKVEDEQEVVGSFRFISAYLDKSKNEEITVREINVFFFRIGDSPAYL